MRQPHKRAEVGDFPVVVISHRANEMLAELNQASFEFALIDGSTDIVNAAYTRLGNARKNLCEYLSKLEADASIARVVTLRF